jgi:hypothetical protein
VTTTTRDKLARLSRYGTAYEVTATHQQHASILIGYTPRKSFAGLYDAFRQHGKHFGDLTGSETAERDRMMIVFDSGWIIRFSGRTERDAISNGERPFIRDLTALDYDPNQI